MPGTLQGNRAMSKTDKMSGLMELTLGRVNIYEDKQGN